MFSNPYRALAFCSLCESFAAFLVNTTSQTEVAYGQVAVGVENEVGWLEVTVQDISAVDVLKAPEKLVT